MRLQLESEQPRAPTVRSGLEQRSLSPGTGAQVDPDRVLARQWRIGQSKGNELAALVLHAGAPVPDRCETARVTLGQSDREA